MDKSVKTTGRKDIPYRLLPEDPEGVKTVVWRYMDEWKFIDLIKQRRIYLCRGDNLQDQHEGTFSRQQLMDQDRWLEKIGCNHLIQLEKIQREANRRRFYISSCIVDPYFRTIV